VVLVVALRLAVFGSWAPNPVLAKSSFPPTMARISEGIWYVIDFARERPVLLPALLVVLLLSRERFRVLWPAWALLVGTVGLVVWSGGDWMEMYRFLVPVLPLFLVLLLSSVAPHVLGQRPWIPVAFGIICSVVAIGALRSMSRGMDVTTYTSLPITSVGKVPSVDWNIPAPSTRVKLLNVENRRDVIEGFPYFSERIPALSQELGRPPVILTRQMGLVPYYIQTQIGTAHFVDKYGLTDRVVARSNWPRWRLGVKLEYEDIFLGDSEVAEYLRGTSPDLIFDIYFLPSTLEETRRAVEPFGYRLDFDGATGNFPTVGVREGHLYAFVKTR
jgi:hypothetical protein